MTCNTAASSGARRAILDATEGGASVCLRLGFEVVGRLTRYARALGNEPEEER